MPNGLNSFWLCPDIITGTILPKKRASTRILQFIFRGLIGFLELTTIQRNGRNVTAWTAKKFRLTFSGRRLIHLQKGKECLKNPVRPVGRPWVTLHRFSLPAPSQDISLV